MSVQWRNVLTQLALYIGTLLFLAVLVFVFRIRPMIWVLWLVALGWGVALVFLLQRTSQTSEIEARLKGYLDQALSYQAQINQLLQTAPPQRDQITLAHLVSQVDNWTGAIQDLVQRVSNLQQDPLIRRDLKEVPAAIASLEARLAQATDPTIRTQLERTLVNRRKQFASLEQLQTIIDRAEIQMESTLSMLGTIYSQLLTGQSTTHFADYSRLSAEVDEEVRQLQDQLEALREVKLEREK